MYTTEWGGLVGGVNLNSLPFLSQSATEEMHPGRDLYNTKQNESVIAHRIMAKYSFDVDYLDFIIIERPNCK